MYRRTHMRKRDERKLLCNCIVTTLSHCCSPVNVYRISLFEEHLWMTTCENTYGSGHSVSALLKPCASQDDVK